MAEAKLGKSARRETEALPLRAEDRSSAEPPAGAGDTLPSLAHDFNNLVGVMLGYVELLSMSKLDPAQRRQLDAIRSAVGETEKLAGRLSGCARTLDARTTRGNDGAMHERVEAFDLASTFVCLDANEGAAARIEVGPTFWETIDGRADLREGRLVALFRFGADWDHWEMHPEGEEVLVLVSGAMDLVLEKDGAERVVDLRPGQACIVPRGTWHRAVVHEPSALIAITAGSGTQHRPVSAR